MDRISGDMSTFAFAFTGSRMKLQINVDHDNLTNIVVALRPPVEEAGLVRAADLRLLRVSLVELVALLRGVEETAAREAVESAAAAGLIRDIGEAGRLLRLLWPRPGLWPRLRAGLRLRFRPPPAAGAALLLLLLALLQQVELTQRRELAVRQVEFRRLGRPRRPPLRLGLLGYPRRRWPSAGGRLRARRLSLNENQRLLQYG